MSEQKNLRTVELQEKPLKQPQRTRRGEGNGKEKNVEVMFNGKCIESLLNKQNLL
jgi:hypothetical protein